MYLLIRQWRQVLMAPRPTLLRATRTNMIACAIVVVVADAAVAGSGSKAFRLTG